MKPPKLRHSVIVAAALLIGTGTTAALVPEAEAAASIEQKVVELVNKARADAGCGAVSLDSRLTSAAAAHSTDMANRSYFDHTTPDGVTFAQRITRAGYPSPGAENIAMGYQSAEQVMDGWMKSAGHKANILNCSVKKMGVAVDTNGYYWTQDFGR